MVDCRLKKNENLSSCKKSSGKLKCRRIDGGYRECSPTDFLKEYKKCGNDYMCKGDVRGAFQTFERGRYYKGIDELHNFAARLDKDELEEFNKEFPDVVKAINQFAEIEEQRKV